MRAIIRDFVFLLTNVKSLVVAVFLLVNQLSSMSLSLAFLLLILGLADLGYIVYVSSCLSLNLFLPITLWEHNRCLSCQQSGKMTSHLWYK